jgi:glycosyltransferase involved in cell wall biosynthesis
MKVAIVHDWLEVYAGAEKTLEQMLHCFPEADLFAVVDFLPPHLRGFLGDRSVRTTFIQHLPLARRRFRSYLLWMPVAIEQLNLSSYDVVISSSHAVAKGVLTGSEQLHICYCYTPMRYAWQMQEDYLNEFAPHNPLKRLLARWVLHRMRQWDARTANGVDAFVAISRHVARRIWKVYRRASTVIFPPVDVESLPYQERKEDFYLTVSRLTPYKRVEQLIAAFAGIPDKRLVVIGEGSHLPKAKAVAGPNTTLMGYQSAEVVRDHLRRARAFVYAAEEDFGISPVEAQACGTPVIAFGKGGVLETVRGLDSEQPTGVLYGDARVPTMQDAVRVFEANASRVRPQACRENAMRFRVRRFRDEFTRFIERTYQAFQENSPPAPGPPEFWVEPPFPE